MATFKDNQDREWHITLDAPTIREVRQACEVDLADTEGKAVEQLINDPCLLVNVLWVLVKDQAQGHCTERDFGRALVGAAIDAATEAMVAGIADFFPPAKSRLIRAVSDKNSQLRSMAMEQAMNRINNPELEQKLLAAMQQRMDEELQATLTRLHSATNTPASSE